MYVTLEPCAHQGRQPPCVEAILEAGIARVVIASDDPSEKASGRGPGILRDGGVEVELRRRRGGDRGAPAQPALPQARPHRPAAGHPEAGDVARRPDHDRRPATRPGSPAERAATLVHRWRAESDAIAVGIGTVLADDPLLTARVAATPASPLRVVFDSQARLPLDSQLLATLDQSPVLVVTAPERRPDRVGALRDAGAEILVAGATSTDRALAELGRRDITSLFLEGGRTLASAFVAADQIDESRTFIAPRACSAGAPSRGLARGGSRATGPARCDSS